MSPHICISKGHIVVHKRLRLITSKISSEKSIKFHDHNNFPIFLKDRQISISYFALLHSENKPLPRSHKL